jgi:hypothetical protein
VITGVYFTSLFQDKTNIISFLTNVFIVDPDVWLQVTYYGPQFYLKYFSLAVPIAMLYGIHSMAVFYNIRIN